MEEIYRSDRFEVVGPPEPVAALHRAKIIPNGRCHMALQCWEQFAWKHLATRSLQASKENDVLDVHGALARMVFDIMFPDNVFTPHYLINFVVGREEGNTSPEGNRWRIREVFYRVPLLLEGEAPNSGDDERIRLMKVEFGHYDA